MVAAGSYSACVIFLRLAIRMRTSFVSAVVVGEKNFITAATVVKWVALLIVDLAVAVQTWLASLFAFDLSHAKVL